MQPRRSSNPAGFHRASGFSLPTPAAAPAGSEFPFSDTYGRAAGAEDPTDVAPNTEYKPDEDPPAPERPARTPPREVNLTTGRVTGSGQQSIPANGFGLVGMPALGQPQAVALVLLAAATGLEIVPADTSATPGFAVPFTNPPLSIQVAQAYIANRTGAAIVCSYLSIAHNA